MKPSGNNLRALIASVCREKQMAQSLSDLAHIAGNQISEKHFIQLTSHIP